MKTNLNRLVILALLVSMSALWSCGSDDDEDAVSRIVGTWTYQNADIDFTIDGQTAQAYFTSIGLDATLAAIAAATVEAEATAGFEEDFAGTTITFNADGTYTANTSDGAESGTYTLNSNETQVSVNTDGDVIVFDIKQLTSSRLTLSFSESSVESIDEDSGDATINVTIDLNFTK